MVTTPTTRAKPDLERRRLRSGWWRGLGPETELGDRVTVTELLALAAAAIGGLTALVSLAAAHLHHYSGSVAVITAGLATLAIAAVVLRFNRPQVQLDVGGLLIAGLGVVLAAVMVFPGFPYATGDRDPGVYVETGASIQRTGSISYRDDLLAADLPAKAKPASVQQSWPGLWRQPKTTDGVFPQFYHLWPALLATGKALGGWTGLFNLGPLCAVVAVALAVALARRLAGLPAALAVAVILPTNMLEVWQAKYPTSEIFSQLLFVGALAAVAVAARTRWRAAAAVGGFLVGLLYLERADGILIVLIAWAVLAALVAVRRFDARAGWFTAGLVVLLPYGYWQAYHLAWAYTVANHVPSSRTIALGMAAVAVAAIVISRWRPFARRVIDVGSRRRFQITVGWLVVVLCAGLELVGLFRQQLFGVDRGFIDGAYQRTYDEASLIRLSWFFTWPGLVLVVVGVALVALRRWRLDRWLVAAPAVALCTVYCYHSRNSPYLMFNVRRFVPVVVPGLALLIGFGIALAAEVVASYVPARLAKGAVAVAVAGFLVFNLSESWPLRSHHEHRDSLGAIETIASVTQGRRGVFFWEPPAYCCSAPASLFGGPLFAVLGQSSSLIPSDYAQAAALMGFDVPHFTVLGRPVFYVADHDHRPPAVRGVKATPVLRLGGDLPHWEETSGRRPDGRRDYYYKLTVYRLTPAR